MKSSNEFEDILQEALSEYRDAEPLAGLDDRVLRCLLTQPMQRPSLGWKCAVLAATAAVVVVVWIGLAGPAHRGSYSAKLAHKPAPVLQAQPKPGDLAAEHVTGPKLRQDPQSYHARRLHPAVSAVMARDKPKRMPERFPVPAPLTREERSLLALARMNPEALRPPPDKENATDIAPIAIKPLLEDASGIEGEN